MNADRVEHIFQTKSWDCGIACALMVCRALGLKSVQPETLEKLIGTESVWTIDLAVALKRLGVSLTFFTTATSANPAYADHVRETVQCGWMSSLFALEQPFYKDDMEDDERRVAELFAAAPKLGLTVRKQCVLLAVCFSSRALFSQIADSRAVSSLRAVRLHVHRAR